MPFLRRDAKVELLKRVPLFERCSRRQLVQIAAVAEEQQVRPGRELTREGDRGHEFFILVEGTAEVRRRGLKLASLGPGDFAGEMSLLSELPRSATVRATSAGRVLVLRERDFKTIVRRTPGVAFKVLEALVERIPPAELG